MVKSNDVVKQIAKLKAQGLRVTAVQVQLSDVDGDGVLSVSEVYNLKQADTDGDGVLSQYEASSLIPKSTQESFVEDVDPLASCLLTTCAIRCSPPCGWDSTLGGSGKCVGGATTTADEYGMGDCDGSKDALVPGVTVTPTFEPDRNASAPKAAIDDPTPASRDASAGNGAGSDAKTVVVIAIVVAIVFLVALGAIYMFQSNRAAEDVSHLQSWGSGVPPAPGVPQYRPPQARPNAQIQNLSTAVAAYEKGPMSPGVTPMSTFPQSDTTRV